MASDAYISTTSRAYTKTVHLNSAAAITAPMQYAIWDRVSASATVICSNSTDAEAELTMLLAHRGPGSSQLSVVTVPA